MTIHESELPDGVLFASNKNDVSDAVKFVMISDVLLFLLVSGPLLKGMLMLHLVVYLLI